MYSTCPNANDNNNIRPVHWRYWTDYLAELGKIVQYILLQKKNCKMANIIIISGVRAV